MTEYVAKTQAELGAVITTPKLTEKLLTKPPFRFLHDVVTNFIKATGFPENYYAADMLDSTKVTDKESKLAFLTKLVTVVEATTGKKTTAKPIKIIAGAEPEGTNDLLQLLASCAQLSKAQMDAGVKKALGGGAEEEATPAPPAPAPAQAPPAPMEEEKKHKEKKKEEEHHHEEKKHKEKKEKPSKSGGDVPAVSPLTQQPPATTPVERPGTATARKPPPPVKSNEVESRGEPAKPAPGVIVEAKRGESRGKDKADAAGGGAGGDDDAWMKIAEEAETKSSRHHHGGGGDSKTEEDAETAQSYLVKEALDAKKRQEEEARKAAEGNDGGADGGEGGGSGIVLNVHRSKTGDKSGGAMGDSELGKLREQLQMLTKASNPLGKFLEAIHEDIDTMSRELEMWRTEARTQATAAQEAQRQTEESLHDAHAQLQNLEDSINDQLLKINITRATILNNDKTIETMLRMVVNPDTGKGRK